MLHNYQKKLKINQESIYIKTTRNRGIAFGCGLNFSAYYYNQSQPRYLPLVGFFILGGIALTVYKQVYLQYHKEPLQIPYPPGFTGEKTKEDVTEIYVNSQPRLLTVDEIKVVEEFLRKLPYRQQLVVTGMVNTGKDDPLLNLSHEQLDDIELRHSLPKTRYISKFVERSIYTRVLILRESGFNANANLSLPFGR